MVLLIVGGAVLLNTLVMLTSQVGGLITSPPKAAPGVPQTLTPAATGGQESPITITGNRTLNSRPFHLVGGDYTVTWSATSGGRFDFGCAHAAGVDSVADGYEGIDAPLKVDVPAYKTLTGETQAYSVQGGDYYIRALSQCPNWSVTIGPQTKTP
jgi:hypothetical protein